MIVGHVIALLFALGASGALGASLARGAERRRLLAPSAPQARERRVNDFEARMRRRVGAPRMHPDPEHASRLLKMRVHR